MGISLIVACIGYFVLDIFVDGVFQDPFAKTVVYIFERIGMDELEAIRVYRLIFVQINNDHWCWIFCAAFVKLYLVCQNSRHT